MLLGFRVSGLVRFRGFKEIRSGLLLLWQAACLEFHRQYMMQLMTLNEHNHDTSWRVGGLSKSYFIVINTITSIRVPIKVLITYDCLYIITTY